jgi:20S proteasome alpha/beta subunit
MPNPKPDGSNVNESRDESIFALGRIIKMAVSGKGGVGKNLMRLVRRVVLPKSDHNG